MCPIDSAQQSVHPTGGIRPAKKEVNYAQTNPVKSASPRPTHQRVTLTVGQHNTEVV